MYCYKIKPNFLQNAENLSSDFNDKKLKVVLWPSESAELTFKLPNDLLITKYATLCIDSHTKLNLGVEWEVNHLSDRFSANAENLSEQYLVDSDFFLMTDNFKTLDFMKRYLYNAGTCELKVIVENRLSKKLTLQNISLIIHSTWNKDLKEQIKQVMDNRKLSHLYFNMENGGVDAFV